MRIDIHVHTGRFSGCAMDMPRKVVAAAVAAGLDALVFTEHDLFWPRRELEKLQRSFPALRLFNGAEMTTAEGEHIIVLGMEDFDGLWPLLPAEQLLRAVHRRGGIAILAHPWRFGPPSGAVLAGIDALEVASTNISAAMAEKILQIQAHTGVPVVAGSDSHSAETVGLYGIELNWRVEEERQLAEAIVAGEFKTFFPPQKDFFQGWKRQPLV